MEENLTNRNYKKLYKTASPSNLNVVLELKDYTGKKNIVTNRKEIITLTIRSRIFWLRSSFFLKV